MPTAWALCPTLPLCHGRNTIGSLRFRQANGTILERWTGFAVVHAGGTRTVDEVVFGEPGDMLLLGARSLQGLNLRVDPVLKQLVDAGSAPAAVASAA